eukprot:GFYU01015875.1.p1 GENE.GFYU01015875.1~~GFYU01015875.1.p1  ORF type:complete len:113 (+),score=6.36 GFYU01015875.1:510-848(+)
MDQPITVIAADLNAGVNCTTVTIQCHCHDGSKPSGNSSGASLAAALVTHLETVTVTSVGGYKAAYGDINVQTLRVCNTPDIETLLTQNVTPSYYCPTSFLRFVGQPSHICLK